jgi:hypothetical protein
MLFRGKPKPRPRRSAPKVYMAGKIHKNDWRHHLVDLREVISSGDNDDDLLNPNLAIDCGDFVYVGPFFVGCDHGCSHGDNRHGAIGGCAGDSFMEPLAKWHRKIFDINLRRLQMADFVFAYIESPDAYGSLIELGIAHAWHIPIALRLPPPPHESSDMWMAAQAATRVYRGSVDECWEKFHRRHAGRLSERRTT